MKTYVQLTMFMMLILMLTASDSSAQRLRQRRPGGGRRGGVTIQRDVDSTNQRKDVEGTIWEFKVMDSSESNKSKQTKMTGRIRIKQSSVFAVGEVEVAEKTDHKGSGDAAQMMKEFDKKTEIRSSTSLN